jgi:hypothetical protein
MEVKDVGGKIGLLSTLFVMIFLVGMVSPVAGYTMDGNRVYIDDSKVYIAQEPHTLYSSGWVTNTLIPKQYSGNIDVVFGFNSTTTHPTRAELYSPHTVTETRSYTCDPPYWYNYTSTHFWCWHTRTTTVTNNQTGQNETITTTNLIFDHDYETADPATNTAYWTEARQVDYINVADRFNRINYNHKGKDTWYYARNVPVQAGRVYKLRIYVQTQFNTTGKYDWCVKPSSESLQEAIAKGHLYCLDPWWNSSWLYARTINITNNADSVLEKGYTIQTEFDLMKCINDGKCLPSGDDVRVVWNNSGNLTEIHRVIEQGSALEFDGNGDYVSVGTGLSPGSGNYSISFWFKTGAENNYASGSKLILGKGTGGGDMRLWVSINATGHINFYMRKGSETGGSVWTDVGGWDDGNLHHFVGVRSRTPDDNRMLIYMDGVLRGDETDYSSNVVSSSTFYIGRSSDSYSDRWFNGTLDEFSVFNRTLNASEIISMYNNGSPRPITSEWFDTSGLMALYHFDLAGCDTSNTACDSIGSNSGTLSGDTYHTDSFIVPTAESINKIHFAIQEDIIGGNSNTDYLLFYGNSNATTPPDNESNVFLFYDDFNRFDSSTTGNGWNDGVTGSIANNMLKVACPSDNWWPVTDNSVSHSAGDSFIAEWRAKPVGTPYSGNKNLYMFFTDGSGRKLTITFGSTNNKIKYTNPSYVDTDISMSEGRWYDFKVVLKGTGKYNFYVDGSLKASDATLGTGASANIIGVGADYSTGTRGYIDDYKVRKYIFPEPTVTLTGQEESAPINLSNATFTPSSGAPGETFTFSIYVDNPFGEDTNLSLYVLDESNTTVNTNSTIMVGGSGTASVTVTIDEEGSYSYYWEASSPSTSGRYPELGYDGGLGVYVINYAKDFSIPAGVEEIRAGVHWYGVSSSSEIIISLSNGTTTYNEFEVPTFIGFFERVEIPLPLIGYNVTLYSGYKELTINNPNSGNWKLMVLHSNVTRIETAVRWE